MILPSGAELKITLSSFEKANELLQAFSEEAKGIRLDPDEEFDINFFKEAVCAALSSKKIQKALWDCMDRALIDGKHVTKQTFEPEEARQDYLDVMTEVAKANLLPFVKGLYAKYAPVLEKLQAALS